MSNFRTFSVQDTELEAIAGFLKNYLFVLPSLPLVDMDRFPRVQCIYFVVSSSTLYYIGCTKNLYLRWLRHNKEEDALKLSNPRIYWFACSGLSIDDSFRLEQSLLREVPTRWNGMKPKPDRSLWMRTELYSSHGSRYCRFRWGKGRESWGYVHVNGGDAGTKLVQGRQRLVDEAIRSAIAEGSDSGAGLLAILQLLQQFPAERTGRKKSKRRRDED